MSLLRARGRSDSGRVDSAELFFDLVFVFAVTQLSHGLLADLSWAGAARAALLLLAVWWVWIYTTWVTNWLDPARIPVRLALFVLMFAGLALSASIPRAFTSTGMAFAASYVFMQVGRTLFFIWAVRGESVRLRRNFQRILAWLLVSAVFWLLGGAAEGETRYVWWSLALAVDFVSPWAYFWVPGLGRSTTADWDIEGSHLAERCGLFVIIALGESLLVTGATFTGLEWTAETLAAFGLAVTGSILMWWIYFDTGAQRAHHRIVHPTDPGRHGRTAYTYLHAPIIAGIIVSAVGDELVLMHPDHGGGATAVVVVGAAACYLVGVALFKWSTNRRKAPPLSHLIGLGLLAILAVPAARDLLTPLRLAAATTGVLLVVAAWETIALRRARS
jgi:low temperature requirement protein LtrA